jgi:polysaccharide export outer membrane protein
MRAFVTSCCLIAAVASGLDAGPPEPASAPSALSALQSARPLLRQSAAPGRRPDGPPAATLPKGVTPPPDYVIGPEDVLAILFWREKDLSVEQVVVRPDGMITLPLLNDVQAAGLTPEQLRDALTKAASRFVEDPNATVVVRQINSRKVFVTGQVGRPGAYPLLGPTTVLQALAQAGGLLEYAKANDILVMRQVNGRTQTFKFRYKDVIRGKHLEQNIELKPGDTVVVP